MYKAELTGLVLTHGDRDPVVALQQLSTVCEQVVVVQDTSSECAELSFSGIEDGTDITVVERNFDTFPAQRNAGIEKARGSWVLSVDSDELLTRDLAGAITELEPDHKTEVYAIPRQERFHGRALRARLYCDYHPRLFRSHIRYAPTPEVHEEFEGFDYGTMAFIEAPLVHDMTESLATLCRKSLDYGQTWQATHQDDGVSLTELAAVVPNAFINKQYWRDGLSGIGMAAVQFSYGLGRHLNS